jgi:peptidoglycan/xylan/chitin deacetylase (PgdA/CDA1 family)
MKAIMYHYVCPFNKELPYFKNLNNEDFIQQLDFFEKHFGFVTKRDFLDSFKTGIIPTGIVLTFDDGLKCHYDFVFKELKKRNLWGIFYVPTNAYSTNKVIDVHRIHLLLGRNNSKLIYDELIKIVSNEMLPDLHKKEFNELTYKSQQNDDFTLLVKRILNYYISYEFREQVLDKLMVKFVPKEIDKVSYLYLSPEEINEMHENGMFIGSHTVSHSVMSKLSFKEQEKEIINSFELLNNITKGLQIKTFCYPYGGFHTFTNETENILINQDCLFSFNVEHRDIIKEDIKNRPQALPRYDCNCFPYGKCREF